MTSAASATGLIIRLGITQVAGYGSLFYAFAVLQPRIIDETGWSKTFVFLGYTLAVAAAGLLAPAAGRWMDRAGCRVPMTLGSLMSATGLTLLAMAATPATYVAAWLVIGLSMRLVLYEAAFTAIAQIRPDTARRTITTMTLIGGFASTLFWPLTQQLIDWIGWRGCCLALAAINLCICAPLHALLPAGAGRPSAPGSANAPARGLLSASGRIFLLMATVFALYSFMFYSVPNHAIAMIERKGLSAAEAVAVGMLIGPSQVAGRIVEISLGGRFHPLATALAASLALPVGLLVLALATAQALLFLFGLFYGIAQGLFTIVRGTLPLALFGAGGFGEVQGRLARISLAASAAAPVATAMVQEAGGDGALHIMLGTLSLLILVLVLMLIREAATHGVRLAGGTVSR
jgi:predicted MFS family arabinose efflux permease